MTNDAVTSYVGAIGFEPGAVVAAGTGVIALAGDRDGNFARSDGWGYILGDDGGGYYIGGGDSPAHYARTMAGRLPGPPAKGDA